MSDPAAAPFRPRRGPLRTAEALMQWINTAAAAASAVVLVIFVALMVAVMMRVVDVRKELVK